VARVDLLCSLSRLGVKEMRPICFFVFQIAFSAFQTLFAQNHLLIMRMPARMAVSPMISSGCGCSGQNDHPYFIAHKTDFIPLNIVTSQFSNISSLLRMILFLSHWYN
jgi:hypothetical protein